MATTLQTSPEIVVLHVKDYLEKLIRSVPAMQHLRLVSMESIRLTDDGRFSNGKIAITFIIEETLE